MDRFTREVVGVSVMTEHSAELVVRALMMALLGSDTTPIWFHSDQGSEYTSYALTQLLARHGIHASHSPKSSPVTVTRPQRSSVVRTATISHVIAPLTR